MKRFLLPLISVAISVVLIGVTGFWVVKTTLERSSRPLPDARKDDRLPRGAPISFDEMEALRNKGEIPAQDLPRLLACFAINDEDLSAHAAETLKGAGVQAVEPLRSQLKHKNARVRFWVIQTLALIGAPSAHASHDLLASLKDEDASVRHKAAYALGQIAGHDGESTAVIDGLVLALSDSDADVVESAAEALGNVGAPAAPKMVQALVLVKGPPRLALLNALVNLNAPLPPAALPILTRLVKDPDESVRQPAITLLAPLGEPAIPTLRELLNRGTALDQVTLLEALAKLGPRAQSLLPDLQALLLRQDPSFAYTELLAIFKQCGPDGARALAGALATLKKDQPVPGPRNSAILTTLGEMGAEAKDAVPVLMEWLKSENSFREPILQTLGDIGPAASAAIPAVQALTSDPNLREAARTTLRRMGVIEKKIEKSKSADD